MSYKIPLVVGYFKKSFNLKLENPALFIPC